MECRHDIGAPRGQSVTPWAPAATTVLRPASRFARQSEQLRIHAMMLLINEEIEEPIPGHDLLPQRH
ncbi:MAG: hypothetical protein ACO3UX_12190, partial [Candidatus Nanopelagicales bacterium]